MSLKNCRRVILPKIGDERGLLSFAEGGKHVPFDIKRIFYSYAVPDQKSRGAHAHKKLEQFILALGGSFEVELDDGQEKQRFLMDKPWEGLYVAPMTWTSVENFQQSAVCMVLASDVYDEADYYREYSDFLKSIVF